MLFGWVNRAGGTTTVSVATTLVATARVTDYEIIIAAIVGLGIGDGQTVRAGARDPAAIGQGSAVEPPTINERQISENDGRKGAGRASHVRLIGRLQGNQRRHQHCYGGKRAGDRADAVGYHHRIAAGIGRLDVGQAKKTG